MAALTPLSKARAAWRVLLPADRLACSSVCPFSLRPSRTARDAKFRWVSVACLLHVCFVLFFLQDAPAGRSLPEDHSLDTAQHARKGGANLHHMTWERGQPPPAAIDASALRARRRCRWRCAPGRRCRWRCAPGRLRRAFERVVSASGGGPSSSGSSGRHEAALRAAGGWVKARECGGGGAWRWRMVKGREGAYGGRTRAQRSRCRRG